MKSVFIVLAMLMSFCVQAQSDGQNLARQYLQNGETEKAAIIYQNLFKQNNEPFFQEYFNCLIQLKQFSDAEVVAKKMIRKYPENVSYQLALGNVYREQGNQARAEALDDQILKALPSDPQKILEAATLVYATERTDFAIKIFLQGRKILKDEHLFSYQLISLYRIKKNKFLMTDEYLNLLQVNPEYLEQAQNHISALFDGAEDYEKLKNALLKLIQKHPQQIAYTELLIWQYLQQNEYDLSLNQAIALNRRLHENGSRIFQLCQTIVANEAYDTAIRGYEYLISKDKSADIFIPAKIELINTKNLKIISGNYVQNDLLSLVKDYYHLLDEFGRNSNTVFAIQKLARLEAFKLHHLAEAEKLLEEAINIKNIRPVVLAACKMDLGDVYLLDNQPWEATLLFSQVEKDMPNTVVGQEARFRNAQLAYYTGDFVWAKAQLDILKAATSQLIANDALNLSLLISDNITFDTTGNALKMYARADLLLFKEQYKQALITLDSIENNFPGNSLSDDVYMAKAKIYIQERNYNRAMENLQKISAEYADGLWADDALFMMADLYENRLLDESKAAAFYRKIITDYPGSLWLNEARKRFRHLRGDNVAE